MKLRAFNPDPNLPNDRYISQLNAARINAGIEGNAGAINVARKFVGQIFSALFQPGKYEGIKRDITDAVTLYTNKGLGHWKSRLIGRNMVKADFKKQDCQKVADMYKAAGGLRSGLSDYQEKVRAFGEHLNDGQKQAGRLNERLKSLRDQGLSDQVYQEVLGKIADHQQKLDAFTSSVIDLGNQWRAGENALKPGNTDPFQDRLKNIGQACEGSYSKNEIVQKSYFYLEQEIDGLEKKLVEEAKLRNQYTTQWTQLQSDISAREESLKNLQNSCSNLQEQLASLQNLQDYVSAKLPDSEILEQLNTQHKAIEEKIKQQESAINEMSNKIQSLKDTVAASLENLSKGDIKKTELERQDAAIHASFDQIQSGIEDLEKFTLQPEIEQLKTNLNRQLNQKLRQDFDVAKSIFVGCKAPIESYKAEIGSIYGEKIKYLSMIRAEISKTEGQEEVIKKLKDGNQKLVSAYDQFEGNFQKYDQKENGTQNALQNLEKLLNSGNGDIEVIQKSEAEVNRTVEDLRKTTSNLMNGKTLEPLSEINKLNVDSIVEEALKDVLKETIQASLKNESQEVKDLFAKFGK